MAEISDGILQEETEDEGIPTAKKRNFGLSLSVNSGFLGIRCEPEEAKEVIGAAAKIAVGAKATNRGVFLYFCLKVKMELNHVMEPISVTVRARFRTDRAISSMWLGMITRCQ